MTSDFEDLIQREIDGDLSPEEQARLVAAASTDPEVRVQREIMLALGEDLHALAWCEPPADLPDRIMAEVAAGTPERTQAFPARRAPRRWRPDRRQLLAFAAGIVLMFVAGQLAPRLGTPDFDESDAAGTMVRTGDSAIDRGSFGTGDARVEAWTERRADRLYLHARGEADAMTPVRIEWDDQTWSVASVRRVPAGALEVDPGRARFVQQETGPFTLELEFQLRRPGTPGGDVRLRFEGSGAADQPLRLVTDREVPGR